MQINAKKKREAKKNILTTMTKQILFFISIIVSICNNNVIGQDVNNGVHNHDHDHIINNNNKMIRSRTTTRQLNNFDFGLSTIFDQMKQEQEQEQIRSSNRDDTTGFVKIGDDYRFFPWNIDYLTNRCPISSKKNITKMITTTSSDSNSTTNSTLNNTTNHTTTIIATTSSSRSSSSSSALLYEPECILGNDVRGSWICRTLYDVVTGIPNTFSACIDQEHYLSTDTCGCCHKKCPNPCICKCDLMEINDQQGVYVMNLLSMDIIESNNNNTTNSTTKNLKCVDPYHSYQYISGPGFGRQPICYTDC